jgi:hypothetical protein
MNELEEFNVYRNEKSYEHYREINPELSLKMYNYLKGNGSLWKVSCGVGVRIKWDTEPPLKAVWFLNNDECYKNRYNDNN